MRVDAKLNVEYSDSNFRLFLGGNMNEFKLLKKLWLPLLILSIVPFSYAQNNDEEEEVTVIGSNISRSLQEQTVPVDVTTRDDFIDAGNPNILDIIANMPAISGTANRQNQYNITGAAVGFKSMNIRGLGVDRSLVLINGKRQVVSPVRLSKAATFGVDVGNIPMIAIERIELLKSGGAVTYGSDAIAGVANFKTRSNFEGFEMVIQNESLTGSPGNNSVGLLWGAGTDNAHFTLSMEWEKVGGLPVIESKNVRDGLTRWGDPVSGGPGWPDGNSSFGNPGAFYYHPGLWNGPANADGDFKDRAGDYTSGQGIEVYGVRDPICGTPAGTGASPEWMSHKLSLNRCGYSYVPFVNLVEDEDRIKVFSEMRIDISDNFEMYADALFGRMKAINHASPSYPPTSPSYKYFSQIPTFNPGFQDFLTQISDTDAAKFAASNLTVPGTVFWWGRPLAAEGPPMIQDVNSDTYRFSAGFRGDITDAVALDISLTYGRSTAETIFRDTQISRYKEAVAGLAGFQCPRKNSDPLSADNDALRGDTTKGCYYFYPSGTFKANPGDALYNDPKMWDYITGASHTMGMQEVAQFDMTFTGLTDVEMAGGNLAWAAGLGTRYFGNQYNAIGEQRARSGDGPVPYSDLFFLASAAHQTNQYNRVTTAFAELNLPATDIFSLDLGVRYEDYDVGTITKPKVSFLVNASDTVDIRMSYEEVYRVPLLPTSQVNSFESYAPLGEYLTITQPVPTGISPEESQNLNFGIIVNDGQGFTMTADYYSYALKGPFNRESPTCDCAQLYKEDRTLYNPDTDSLTDVAYIVAEFKNADDLTTSGIDFELQYQWGDAINHRFGANGNYILEYEVEGYLGATSTYDAVGVYNTDNTKLPYEIRSLPQYKLNLFYSLLSGGNYFGIIARYIDGMEVSTDLDRYSAFDGSATSANWKSSDGIDSMTTLDLHYRYSFEAGVDINVSVLNVADEAPPIAPHEMGYDSFTHNPLGRVFKVGLTYTLQN